jgi:hypothetical protein
LLKSAPADPAPLLQTARKQVRGNKILSAHDFHAGGLYPSVVRKLRGLSVVFSPDRQGGQ